MVGHAVPASPLRGFDASFTSGRACPGESPPTTNSPYASLELLHQDLDRRIHICNKNFEVKEREPVAPYILHGPSETSLARPPTARDSDSPR